jgi:hypothetical protein
MQADPALGGVVTLRNPHPQDDELPADLIIDPAPRTPSLVDGGESTDDRRCNARLRRVVHLAASVPGATSFWRAAARRCRAARKALGPAPWLPTSRRAAADTVLHGVIREHLDTFLARGDSVNFRNNPVRGPFYEAAPPGQCP